MSTILKRRMMEDRALRDAALAVVKVDIANLRSDLADKGVGKRVIDRIGAGAIDVFDEAVDLADNNRGVLATLVGAIVIWFARNPLIAMFSDDLDNADPDDSDDDYDYDYDEE